MSRDRAFWSKRNASLVAVTTQSTLLAIVLHVSQNDLEPGQAHFRTSSAVLLTEIGKLALSLGLAYGDVRRERADLTKPRHALPSPELYASAEDVHKNDMYADPFDKPEVESVKRPNGNAPRGHIRKRSSQQINANELRLDVQLEGANAPPLHERTLSTFAWPSEGQAKYKEKHQLDPIVIEDKETVTRRRRMTCTAMLIEDAFTGDWWRMAIPAVLFAVQNNLMYIAARNLSVPVFQITFQIKTLMVALAAVVMLKRRLAATQWLALFILACGVATMQLSAITAKANDVHGHLSSDESSTKNYAAGLAAVLVSCACASISSTYFEMVIKRKPEAPEEYSLVERAKAPPKPPSLWIRNIQLSLFSTIIGLVVVFVQANPARFGINGLAFDSDHFVDDIASWYDPVVRSVQGFFVGFRPITWVAIALQVAGGLLTAVALKHADNVVKGFALSLSIVFTFLLSVILFGFRITAPAVLGGVAVVCSTWLYEADPEAVKRLWASGDDNKSFSTPPLLKRWHLVVLTILATTLVCAAFPFHHVSVSNAVWDLVGLDKSTAHMPTIAMADVHALNERLLEAGALCDMDVTAVKRTLQEPFGFPRLAPEKFPYYVRDTDGSAVGAIIRSRLGEYGKLVNITNRPAPDFIYLPIATSIYANGASCNRTEMKRAIERTTAYIRDLVTSVSESNYPRIILALDGKRSDLEQELFTSDFMQTARDHVIVVSAENALQDTKEGLTYLVDVPYPTTFHLAADRGPRLKGSIGDHFLKKERPYLFHYAGRQAWFIKAPNDVWHGAKIRDVLSRQVREYKTSHRASHQVYFEEFDAFRQPNPTESRQHMEQAIFCLQPPGMAPTRKAFYEAVQLGCVPVLFREKSYGRLFPSSPEVNDVSKYTVFVDENELIKGKDITIIDRLADISQAEIVRKQKRLQEVAESLQWSIPKSHLVDLPDGLKRQKSGGEKVRDAFALLIEELRVIKSGEWQAGRARDTREGFKAKHFKS